LLVKIKAPEVIRTIAAPTFGMATCYNNRSLIVGDTVHEIRKKSKKVKGVGAKKDREMR